jgi:hypothetical protein
MQVLDRARLVGHLEEGGVGGHAVEHAKREEGFPLDEGEGAGGVIEKEKGKDADN